MVVLWDDELETQIGDSWGHGTNGLRSYRPSTTCGSLCSIKGLMPCLCIEDRLQPLLRRRNLPFFWECDQASS